MDKNTLALLAAVLFWSVDANAQTPTHAVVEVRAAAGWVDTGLEIETGDRLRIRSTGAWSNAPGPNLTNAKGWGPYPGAEVADANIASLIGRIGDTRFPVGEFRQWQADRSGRLWLAMNDVPGSSADNQGAVLSDILHAPGAQTHHGKIDVAVTARTAGESGVPIGEKVVFVFEIRNTGEATIPIIELRGEAANLDDVGVVRACPMLPCRLHDLAPGEHRELLVAGITRQAGRYDFQLRAIAWAGSQTANSMARAEGMVVLAPPPPPPERADVSITAVSGTEATVHAGDSVTVDFLVRNAGPDVAVQGSIEGTIDHLDDVRVSGVCNAIPCAVTALQPGGSRQFTVRGRAVKGELRIAMRIADASPVDPESSNNDDRIALQVLPSNSPSQVSVTAEVMTSQLKQGGTLRFQIKVLNRGKTPVRNVVIEQARTYNLGAISLPASCKQSRCTVARLAPNETRIFSGEFELPRTGKVVADFPVRWVAGKKTQRTNATLTDFVPPRHRWWWWVAALSAICVLGYSLCRYVDFNKRKDARLARAWAPRLRVDAIPATASDAPLLTDIPLIAPPLSVQVTLRLGEAILLDDPAVWRKET